MKLRVIDALQLPEVLDGSTWFELPVPIFFGTKAGAERRVNHGMPTMTVGIDPDRQSMHYCDRIYERRAMCPTLLGREATLTLRQLLGECSLVTAPKMPAEIPPALSSESSSTWSCPWCSTANTSQVACRGCGSNSGVPRRKESP